MKLKKLLATALVFVMVFSNAIIANAENGPSSDLSYIYIFSNDYSTEVYLLDNYNGNTIGKIDGATYNQSTNTLSLNNFNQPELCIATNTMGDDFKINLTGENHIQALMLWGDLHGGSCEFTGSGKLYINENKSAFNAIYMSPEGTNAVLKASGSTTINAYAPSGGNAVYVYCTEYKNCIVGNASSTPKVENYSYDKGISVITNISEEDEVSSDYDFYTKQGSSNVFAVKIQKFTNSKYYYIYQVVKNPENDSYILCHYNSGMGDFVASNYGFTPTDEISHIRATSYSSYESLWNDSNGNKCVFLYEYDFETNSRYYQKYNVSAFVTSENYNGGNTEWYITIPTDDTTKYANNKADPINAGYTCEKVILDDVYNVYVNATSYTLSGSAHTHTYKNVVTKATLTKNGKIVPTCSCGATKTATIIYYPKTIALSATVYNYDGKVKTPAVTVKDSKGKVLKKGTDYTVSYASGRKLVGKYAVKITFKGNYSGTKTLYFTIRPKNTTFSLASGKKAITAKIKKYTTQTTGYQIQYATNSKFTSAKTVSMKNTTTSKTISKLAGGKKYYVRVRTYKTVKINGKNTNIYSAWSSAKAVTTKK